jgi:hypothetical protein
LVGIGFDTDGSPADHSIKKRARRLGSHPADVIHVGPAYRQEKRSVRNEQAGERERADGGLTHHTTSRNTVINYQLTIASSGKRRTESEKGSAAQWSLPFRFLRCVWQLATDN